MSDMGAGEKGEVCVKLALTQPSPPGEGFYLAHYYEDVHSSG